MNRIILICLIIASSGLFAQEINFCLNYTVLGEPLRVSNSWSIKEDGGYLYVLYKQPEAITRNLFSIVVSQAQDGVFREINRQRIVPELNKNWVAIYYKFHQGGDFRISVLKNDAEVATNYLTILANKTKKGWKRKLNKDPRLLYTNTKVIACETVRDGKAINPSAVFSITQDYSDVTFLIMNAKTIDAGKLNIDIYRRTNALDQYSQFVESKILHLIYDNNSTYFNLQFIEPGDYKVYIYDQDQVWINSGYVTINAR